jgi:hypothetical protein
MADWGVRIKSPKLNENLERDLLGLVKPAIAELAEDVREELVRSVESGDTSWPPLSETTRFLTGRDRPLVGTGDFVRSIRSQVGDKSASVGVLLPKGETGRDMEAMARVTEGGADIMVTDKMRRWFAAKGRPLRKTTVVIKIPPRPVFNPSVGFIEENIDEIFGEVLDRLVELV